MYMNCTGRLTASLQSPREGYVVQGTGKGGCKMRRRVHSRTDENPTEGGLLIVRRSKTGMGMAERQRRHDISYLAGPTLDVYSDG